MHSFSLNHTRSPNRFMRNSNNKSDARKITILLSAFSCISCIFFNHRHHQHFDGNKAKGRTSKWVFKKTKHVKFSEKRSFYPLIRTCTCAYRGVKKCSFFGEFDVLCFFETPVLRLALLPYY